MQPKVTCTRRMQVLCFACALQSYLTYACKAKQWVGCKGCWFCALQSYLRLLVTRSVTLQLCFAKLPVVQLYLRLRSIAGRLQRIEKMERMQRLFYFFRKQSMHPLQPKVTLQSTEPKDAW